MTAILPSLTDSRVRLTRMGPAPRLSSHARVGCDQAITKIGRSQRYARFACWTQPLAASRRPARQTSPEREN